MPLRKTPIQTVNQRYPLAADTLVYTPKEELPLSFLLEDDLYLTNEEPSTRADQPTLAALLRSRATAI